MCKRCSAYIDLSDYRITQTLSKNFCTHGWVVVEEKGYLLNTDLVAAEAVIKGRVIGKLDAKHTLEIHSSANIKGSITAGCLVIPEGHHFRWPEPLQLGGAEIAGELAADIVSTGTVTLKANSCFFGNIETLNLVVESGAVFVGNAKIGKAPEPAPKKARATAAVPARGVGREAARTPLELLEEPRPRVRKPPQRRTREAR
jgi:cytoskeletal protein CcmA (bactofilin family)